MRLVTLILAVCLPASLAAEEISFRRQVAPILAQRCLGCHNSRKAEGRYALHSFAALRKAGESDLQPVVPGKPAESYMLEKLLERDDDLRMPQADAPLSTEQIALVTQWIQQGALFDGRDAAQPLRSLLPPRQHPAAPIRYRRPIPVFAIAFSSDGQQLWTAGWHELLVWDVETGKLMRRIGGLPQRIHALRFSPDGRTLAVGGGAPGDYGEIRLVDVDSKATPATSVASPRLLATAEDVFLDLQFSPGGDVLFAGGADHAVRAYQVDEQRQIWHMRQHVDWVTAVDVTDYRFSERRVSNQDLQDAFSLTEYDQQSGVHLQRHWRFVDGSFVIREANWELTWRNSNADRASLVRITVTGIGKTYQVKRQAIPADELDEHTSVIEHLRQLHANWPETLPGTELVVSSSKDRSVKVFRADNGKLFTTYKGHRREYGPLRGLHRVYGVQVEPGTRRIWSVGEGQHVHGWNPLTVRDEDGTAADMEARFAKEYSIDLIRHEIPDPILTVLRCDDHLLVGSAGGHVQQFAIRGPDAVFDVQRVAPAQDYVGHGDQLYAVAAHAERSLVAAAGYDGTVVIWDRQKGGEVVKFVAAPQ